MKNAFFATVGVLLLGILGGCSQPQTENAQPDSDKFSSSLEFRNYRDGALNFDASIRREDALSWLLGKGGGVTTRVWYTDKVVELSIVHSEGRLKVICNGAVCESIPVEWISIIEEPKLENGRHFHVCDYMRRKSRGGPPAKKVGLYLFIKRNVRQQ